MSKKHGICKLIVTALLLYNSYFNFLKFKAFLTSFPAVEQINQINQTYYLNGYTDNFTELRDKISLVAIQKSTLIADYTLATHLRIHLEHYMPLYFCVGQVCSVHICFNVKCQLGFSGRSAKRWVLRQQCDTETPQGKVRSSPLPQTGLQVILVILNCLASVPINSLSKTMLNLYKPSGH